MSLSLSSSVGALPKGREKQVNGNDAVDELPIPMNQSEEALRLRRAGKDPNQRFVCLRRKSTKPIKVLEHSQYIKLPTLSCPETHSYRGSSRSTFCQVIDLINAAGFFQASDTVELTRAADEDSF